MGAVAGRLKVNSVVDDSKTPDDHQKRAHSGLRPSGRRVVRPRRASGCSADDASNRSNRQNHRLVLLYCCTTQEGVVGCGRQPAICTRVTGLTATLRSILTSILVLAWPFGHPRSLRKSRSCADARTDNWTRPKLSPESRQSLVLHVGGCGGPKPMAKGSLGSRRSYIAFHEGSALLTPPPAVVGSFAESWPSPAAPRCSCAGLS